MYFRADADLPLLRAFVQELALVSTASLIKVLA